MIGQQAALSLEAGLAEGSVVSKETMVLGAMMLRMAITFDNLKMKGASEREILSYFRHDPGRFDPRLVDALADLEPVGATMEIAQFPSGS
jgi:hypothetical protein